MKKETYIEIIYDNITIATTSRNINIDILHWNIRQSRYSQFTSQFFHCYFQVSQVLNLFRSAIQSFKFSEENLVSTHLLYYCYIYSSIFFRTVEQVILEKATTRK